MIKELLDTRIRPTVMDDGGDIKFISFDPDTGKFVFINFCIAGQIFLQESYYQGRSYFNPLTIGDSTPEFSA